MQKNFGPIVNEKTAEIFSSLTGGRYTKLTVSKDLDVSVRDPETDTTVNWKFLSGGTIDQLYFALRLAVSDFMSETEESLPLFLDDTFIQYDDSRSLNAVRTIKEHVSGNSSQVLLFTCHRTTLDNFEKTDVLNFPES